MTNKDVAWMLRQDGTAFPCIHHLYCMDDDDLSSQAEVSAFIIKTQSKDIDIAENTLDAWMALLLEDVVMYDDSHEAIQSKLVNALNNLPYRFLYPLSIDELVKIHNKQNNFSDFDTLYDFLDNVHLNIDSYKDTIKKSLNQQFCRVRFGGQYDTSNMNNTIWFRISSTNYNWNNTIYVFAINNYRKYKIDKITICRDYESDYGDIEGKEEYIYKAKDGTPYFDMPIEEFFGEEHGHSTVFSSMDINRGVITSVRNKLRAGYTLNSIVCSMSKYGVDRYPNLWNSFIKEEQNKCMPMSECIEAASSRVQTKLLRVERAILTTFHEIKKAYVSKKELDYESNLTQINITLMSDVPELNNLTIDLKYKGDYSQVTWDTIFRNFKREYLSYIEYNKIEIPSKLLINY